MPPARSEARSASIGNTRRRAVACAQSDLRAFFGDVAPSGSACTSVGRVGGLIFCRTSSVYSAPLCSSLDAADAAIFLRACASYGPYSVYARAGGRGVVDISLTRFAQTTVDRRPSRVSKREAEHTPHKVKKKVALPL
jgi:hypothetical protein